MVEELKQSNGIYADKDGNFSHSYRKWPRSHWKKLLRYGDKRKVRATFNWVEDGRMASALDALHRFVYALDSDEKKKFFRNNSKMKKWVNLHAKINGRKEF